MPQHPLIEVHEDRITRLEENVTECRVGLGVLESKLEAGIEMLAKKIDETNHVKDRVLAIEKHHEIEAEVRKRRHDHRLRAFKILAALFSIGGVVGGLLIKIFWGE
jgi:hypothetical protein